MREVFFYVVGSVLSGAESELGDGSVLGAQIGFGDGDGLGDETSLGDGVGLGPETGLRDGEELGVETELRDGKGLCAETGLGDGDGLDAKTGMRDGEGLGAKTGMGDGEGLGDCEPNECHEQTQGVDQSYVDEFVRELSESDVNDGEIENGGTDDSDDDLYEFEYDMEDEQVEEMSEPAPAILTQESVAPAKDKSKQKSKGGHNSNLAIFSFSDPISDSSFADVILPSASIFPISVVSYHEKKGIPPLHLTSNLYSHRTFFQDLSLFLKPLASLGSRNGIKCSMTNLANKKT
ncbi:UDP-3-O-acylglucosamine N-acyltransferase [Striga asiatica]|uniref:UDP-3-O-acylglucosamine N-acyltransferase n=1 Tax=Striga asiatica TaxID=4170 RepID=A0A5A7QFV8_STRAF|nr:UDP-3-O-acylglucosamine N-acyltransferase [Striga asiatica]